MHVVLLFQLIIKCISMFVLFCFILCYCVIIVSSPMVSNVSIISIVNSNNNNDRLKKKQKTKNKKKFLYTNPKQTPFDALFSSTKRFHGLLNHASKELSCAISYFAAILNFIRSRDYHISNTSFRQRFSEGRFTVAADNWCLSRDTLTWRISRTEVFPLQKNTFLYAWLSFNYNRI